MKRKEHRKGQIKQNKNERRREEVGKGGT